MKKFLYVLFLLLIINPVFAITWENITATGNKALQLDIDSITLHKNYYFYNIKTTKNNGEEVIITIQSQKSHPFCARVKYYTPQEYKALNGDYKNITLNLTTRLEPVAFETRAFAAHKRVVQIMQAGNKPQIIF